MENQNNKVNYWMISTLIFGFLFFLMLGVNILSFRSSGKNDIISPRPLPTTLPSENINYPTVQPNAEDQITIEGQIDCLPHRETTRGVTLECAIGLRGKDNKYYSLQGLDQQDLISGALEAGQNVKISGVLTSSSDSRYDTAGTIEVASVENLD
ncbi:hypothetical protein A2W14_04520 [Candidatus Gottesmanbacteria bacterium RBG_16_37_8]|uniref:Uncharacterized protein n=1 Tax=Candidatus Gottesmanbacteria bacterium RBG_16_37_8 TaxID=1798371 RepID=A0A1F5YSN1_9BACT|nr:MAG: hypothetical protein A2W14_04520 [Candidatus Gottesmanbacteria bacterium RBG_16_37_8]